MLRQISISNLYKICILLIVLSIFMCSLMPVQARANDSDAETTIKNELIEGAEDIYGIFTAIVAPLSVVFVAVTGLSVFVGGEKGLEKARSRMLIVLIALIMVYLAPLGVKQIAGWFTNKNSLW